MQLIVALYIKCAKSNFFLIENIDIQHKFTIFVYIILNPNRLMETRTVKTVRIFLASGAELSKDRVEFGNFINKLRVHYMSRGFDLVPIEWEYLENDDHTHRPRVVPTCTRSPGLRRTVRADGAAQSPKGA